MITIEMLPAKEGDCILIEYGKPQNKSKILIDGGTYETYEQIYERMKDFTNEEKVFELLVITHVDLDHIDGIVKLLQNQKLNLQFNDIWFNSWRHIKKKKDDALGPVQGEYLSAQLDTQDRIWNAKFGFEAVEINQDKLPKKTFNDDLLITLLSPPEFNLKELRKVWEKVVTKAKLNPGATDEAIKRLQDIPKYQINGDSLGETTPDIDKLSMQEYEADPSMSNASSIAFILEYDGKRILLGADAHTEILESSLKKYKKENKIDGKIHFDAFKLSHHGSRKNINKNLLDMIDCEKYLISSDGVRHEHPHPEAIAKIIRFGGPKIELFFNYKSNFSNIWNNQELIDQYNYFPYYPLRKGEGIKVRL